MGEGIWDLPPTGAQITVQQIEEHWKCWDKSVDVVSFAFTITAIFFCMFFLMAILERFLRPRSTAPTHSGVGHNGDLESYMTFSGKLLHPSPTMTVYARGVSVLMPGEEIPTFIAHPMPLPLPAPATCPPERISWPIHQDNFLNVTANSSLKV